MLNLASDKREFELSLTKGDFASQLGMTQETLSRKLSTTSNDRQGSERRRFPSFADKNMRKIV